MSNFKKKYLDLLIFQVKEEMRFLAENGHSVGFPDQDCAFCITAHGKSVCARFSILGRFLDELNDKMNKLSGEALLLETLDKCDLLQTIDNKLLPFQEIL